jgi:hypothetical protein
MILQKTFINLPKTIENDKLPQHSRFHQVHACGSDIAVLRLIFCSLLTAPSWEARNSLPPLMLVGGIYHCHASLAGSLEPRIAAFETSAS